MTEERARREEGVKPKRPAFQDFLGFRGKFLLGAALVLLVVCLSGAFLIYHLEKSQLEEHAYEKTQMVMTAVESSREYVREDLRPRMYEEFGSDFFLLEAMSTSYVGHEVMERFNRELPQYRYRRVAVNARNPESEANEMERAMMERFREHEEKQNWQGIIQVGEEEQFMRFKPVYFDESCMSCHGDPADAPQELVQRYGTEGGFGNSPGDLAGVVAAGVPVQDALGEIEQRATSVFFVMFAGLLLFFLSVAVIFNRVVVSNMRSVLNLFKENVAEKSLEDFLPKPASSEERRGTGEQHFRGRKEEFLPPPEERAARDELDELNEAAVIMSEHLQRTQQELQDYAQTLEHKVEERTKALRESERLLQEQVKARDKELQTLNRISELTTQTEGMEEVWRRVLRHSLELIPAEGGGVYLYGEGENQLQLQYQENAPQLPHFAYTRENCEQEEDQEEQQVALSISRALSGNLSTDREHSFSCLNVPMSCRGRVLGVLSFVGLEDEIVSYEQRELLLSVGRQVGIAVESLRDLQRLAQNKELLQTVFDGITDQLLLLDREFRIKMVNQAYLRRYSVEFEDIEGRPCYEVHAGLFEVCPGCLLPRVVENAEARSEELRCPTGEIFLVHFYPVLSESGEVESIIRYAREISEQKKVEQKIQQTEKLVALGQLASGVAHEINNPLSIILCYVDLLKRQLSGLSQGEEDLAVIERQTLNCKNIVTDLLQFSRGREDEKRLVQPNQIIEEVRQMFRHKLKKNEVELLLDLDPELPQISLNEDKIKQVLVNLLMNALQETSPGGRIEIASGQERERRELWISIWDNGSGIDPDIRNRIFDPFFSTKSTGEGTGLGLSVSYGIVQAHGGEITLESEEGCWTRFNIVLPWGEGPEEG